MSIPHNAPDLSGVTGATGVNPEGATWLASAGTYPCSLLSLWRQRPDAPVVLPCGSVFDVVSTPSVFGHRMLNRMWGKGPGSGPVAELRGRTLLFAAPGTAQRLPALLEWEEWDARGRGPGEVRRTGEIPPLLCHGTGDAVTVPPPAPATGTAHHGSRWLVAPDTRHPWLPGPEVLLWAAVQAARATARVSIFPPADQDASV